MQQPEKIKIKLSDIITAASPSDKEEEIKTIDLIDNLLEIIASENQNNIFENNLYGILMIQIEKINSIINKALDTILHHPEFLEMEGKWRGLKYLIDSSELDSMMKIKLLPASKVEITEDFDKAIDFDQTSLFRKTYKSEYDTYGGQLVTLIVVDDHLSSSSYDCKYAAKLAEVAAAAHAPIFIGASPKMFDVDKWSDFRKITDIRKVMEAPSKDQWNSLREKNDSKYLNLSFPNVMARSPYHPEENPTKGINYIETCDPYNNSDFCWMNASILSGVNILRSYAFSGWPMSICGIEGGGLITDLNVYSFISKNGEKTLKCPLDTNYPIDDTTEYLLSLLGFTALCSCKDSNKAVFFTMTNVFKNQKYTTDYATANSKLATQTSGVLCASRIAHLFKVILRDAVGSFKTIETIQSLLQSCIAQYVLLNDTASQDLKSKYPLREAKINVAKKPGAPGSFFIDIFLMFHDQFNQASTTLNVVSEILED